MRVFARVSHSADIAAFEKLHGRRPVDILLRRVDNVLRPRHSLGAFCWDERLHDLRLRAEAVEDEFRGRFSVELARSFRVKVELMQVAVELFVGLGGRFALASGLKSARFMVCDAELAILAAKDKVDDAAERVAANGNSTACSTATISPAGMYGCSR